MGTSAVTIARDLQPRYAGAHWIARQLEYMKQPAPSPFGCVVANILGDVYQGIYHLGESLLHERTVWHSPKLVVLTLRRELSSHDQPDLTWLVLLAHANGIRLAITGAAPGYVRLQFTSESMYWGHVPNVDAIVEQFNKRYPLAPLPSSGEGQ